jgi:hypothetical protein
MPRPSGAWASTTRQPGQFGEGPDRHHHGPAGEHPVRFASWVNENDRASRGGRLRRRREEPEAIKAKGYQAANKEAWKAHDRALAVIMDEANITTRGSVALWHQCS